MKHQHTIAISLAIFCFAICYSAIPCIATEWGPLKKRVFSTDTGYTFRVIPDHSKPRVYGHCLGELYELQDGIQIKRWARYLINNQSPVSVFLSITGEYVITLDEWGEMGTFPVVIYGPKGKLLHTYSINDLKIPPGKTKLAIGGNRMWRTNAIEFFTADSKYFVIWFPWERVLIFDLQHDGRLRSKKYFRKEEWTQLQSSISTKTKEIALKMLSSSDPHDRETGAIALGQLRTKTAIPRLKKLLNDPSFSVRGGAGKINKVFYVREAAQKALDLIQEKTAVDEKMTELNKEQN